jgi:hypothetical protein
LTCSWGNGLATLAWATPTQNTDGSTLTNLSAFKVLFGTSASALSQTAMVNNPQATGTTVPALASGTWYFAVRAVTSQQLESANSNVVSKTISAASAAQTVNVTVTAGSPPPPPPPPPTLKLKTIAKRAYDVLTSSDGTRRVGRQVGTIALGKPCGATYKVGADYYRVNKDYVTITVTPRSTYVVVRCAMS